MRCFVCRCEFFGKMYTFIATLRSQTNRNPIVTFSKNNPLTTRQADVITLFRYRENNPA